jgi:galactokinase
MRLEEQGAFVALVAVDRRALQRMVAVVEDLYAHEWRMEVQQQTLDEQEEERVDSTSPISETMNLMHFGMMMLEKQRDMRMDNESGKMMLKMRTWILRTHNDRSLVMESLAGQMDLGSMLL